ncbi:MAG: MotA/TolQ/ExbB proton channel family protein [Rhabdochlamydiaceae bacterium]|jgi:biopolymer transport protein TolQ
MLAPLASLTAFFSAYGQSDLFGKLIIIGLIVLSVICWIVLIYKIWVLQKVKEISSAFKQSLTKQGRSFLDTDLTHFPSPKHPHIPHPFLSISQSLKQKTIDVLNKNHFFSSEGSKEKASVYLTASDLELLEYHASATIAEEHKRLESNIFVLSTIAALAPFMGLLGTVWGILESFSGFSSGGAVGSNSAILGGLSTALATTVLGLIIAIPALVSYNYLKNTVKSYASDMDGFLSNLISTIDIQFRKVE